MKTRFATLMLTLMLGLLPALAQNPASVELDRRIAHATSDTACVNRNVEKSRPGFGHCSEA